MKTIIDIEKALKEKNTMQEKFTDENGYPSSVLTLVIDHFEGMKDKKADENE